jgi:hypothetical protein
MLNQLANLDRVFQDLAGPGRRLMLDRLSQGPTSVGEQGALPGADDIPAAARLTR